MSLKGLITDPVTSVVKRDLHFILIPFINSLNSKSINIIVSIIATVYFYHYVFKFCDILFLQLMENIIHNVAIIDNACVTLFFVPLNVYMIIILFLGFIIIASSIEIIH